MTRRLRLFLLVCGCVLIFSLVGFAASQAAGGDETQLSKAESENKVTQTGPPWYNPSWNYRRPISITNDGSDWLYYQVLVILEGNNFDFDLANEGGTDIRFTLGEGTIPIPFWIESWNDEAQLAYVWVRVPSLSHGISTIYLYYDNPNAINASDGSVTFDGFDDVAWDFCDPKANPQAQQANQSNANGVESPFCWLTIEGTPQVQDGTLVLENGEGVRSTATYQNLAVGFRANFGTGSGYEWAGFYNEDTGKRTMIGDRSSDPTNLFLRNYNTVEMTSLIPRVGGVDWHAAPHIFETRWCITGSNCSITQSSVDVDHGAMSASLASQVPGTALPVTLHNNNSGAASQLRIDWIYVRKYSNVEPAFSVGERQGLVQLGIDGSDIPDPLPIGHPLTYQLTISNNGSIDAPGVVVTDTLPANVELGEINASQGSCLPGAIITCELNTLYSNSGANITIVVTPTSVDGIRTNTALVGSPGFELDLSDNISEQETLVDSVPPVLNWEEPVHSGERYTSYGKQVLLEASAADEDDLVAWVEFLLWDHLSNPPYGSYVSLGIDDTFPYQVVLNSDILVPYETYQLFVLGADRAGNLSNPQDPVQRIYITRKIANFMPLMVK